MKLKYDRETKPASRHSRIKDVRSRKRDLIEERDAILDAFFSDESETFRSPAEPGIFQEMTVRLRVENTLDVQVTLLLSAGRSHVPLRRTRDDGMFAWYEATIRCGLEPLGYRFVIDYLDERFVYQKDGTRRMGPGETGAEGEGYPLPVKASRDFRVMPGFHVPSWARGALQYQIFTDRFANGDPLNDVVDREYSYDGRPVRTARWGAPLSEDDYRCFYGGDLAGVCSKLDYLQSLGVEAIYLNPIFVSPSSHKYDTQDFEHVDPHFGAIPDDMDDPLPHGERNNAKARQYIRRTTSQRNLGRSDALFADLCREIHHRGMRIILDGVFNHCGSFSRWMDREGVYKSSGAFDPGAFQSLDSPYRHYFCFQGHSTVDYEGWWNYHSLPKLNYENAPDLVDRIIGIACKWALPPYSIDGWRLDVAADLGHSEKFNHEFWRRFRAELKRVNPDLLIVAEHYGNASAWLAGDQWDSVMNYDAFMDPLTYFLTGMEKHSDGVREDLYQDGRAFWKTMASKMTQFGWGSLLCAMNELSNHDHSRFLTRTNRTVGRLNTAGSDAAGRDVDKRVMREAVVVQMTWPGAPTIYYGDEAGLVGWTDPDCRRTYPWGAEDQGLISLHRELAQIRRAHPALREGSFVPLGGGHGWISFGRFLADDRIAVACNNLNRAQVVQLRLRLLGIPDGREIVSCLVTSENGFETSPVRLGQVRGGICQVRIPGHTALVLQPR